MSDRNHCLCRLCALSTALVALIALDTVRSPANAQVQLPELTVRAAKKPKAQPRPIAHRVAPPSTVPPMSPAEVVAQRNNSFDQARSNLYTTIGTTSDTLSRDTIQALPQGANSPIERVLLQAPGVTQDSAASGLLHVRNEHGNLQYRINGVMLPDGVTGFGSVLDTNFIGSLSLVTGALPAEFGLRTVGAIDLTTRKDIFNNSGSVNYYFGSRERIQPSFEYGGTFGANCPAANAPLPTKTPASSSTCFGGVQYFFTGNYLQTNEGIENTLPTLNPIHDFSRQERGFAYLSSFLDPYTRLSLIAGTFTGNFQIPNVPNQPTTLNSAFGVTSFNSAMLNERQNEQTQYGVLALQHSVNGFDGQLSYFTRYNNLHFTPDPTGDLLLNGVASDISRQSYSNGFQGDAAYAITPAHTLHAGFTVSAEQIWVDNTSLVEATPPATGMEPPFPIADDVNKIGWLAGIYVRDEWKITDKLTLDAGLRFDQMWQFVEANQLSPRVSLTYNPFENTTLHAGYARYFTPPVLVEAAPVNFNLFNNTTAAVTNPIGSPVLPERSHYFDAGINQVFPLGCYSALPRDCATAEFGVDGYYKIATDLLDDGNFGQALVLNAFNYAKGINEGVEFSAKFHSSYLEAHFNYAYARQKATRLESIPVRQCHAGSRTRRPNRVSIYCDALDLYRPRADSDCIGWCRVPLLRPASRSL